MSKILCGIDEAGRGPVIGPMVMCGYCIAEQDAAALTKANVRDSKLLTPHEREILVPFLKNLSTGYKQIVIGAHEIDEHVASKTSNLNMLEAQTTVKILDQLKPDVAYVDCPSVNVTAYKALLQSKLKHKTIELVVEHKADAKYVACSGASVLAKVKRDEEIEKLKKQVGHDFGSGYPSDPRTQQFLKEHFKDMSHLFRKTWSSYQRLLQGKTQTTLAGFSGDSQNNSQDKAHDKQLQHVFSELRSLGFKSVSSKGAYELGRFKGDATITLYTSGKALVQGKTNHGVALKNLLKGYELVFSK